MTRKRGGGKPRDFEPSIGGFIKEVANDAKEKVKKAVGIKDTPKPPKKRIH